MTTATSTVTSTSSPRFRIDLKWVILGACVVLVAYLAVIPLGFLLWQSCF
jgi:iron(III) transport system permease protein